MRYQEKKYDRAGTCVRNRDHVNVSMSSDVCIFQAPFFDMFGAGKIETGTTTASTGVYIIEGETDIDLEFDFSSGFGSMDENSTFKFEIYKYNFNEGVFKEPAVYKSVEYPFTDFSATSAVTATIPLTDLNIDGDYLVKGYYKHDVCTDILSRLGLTNDTSLYKAGSQYGMYNSSKDFYFVAVQHADTPIFNTSTNSTRPLGSLAAFSIFPEAGVQDVAIPSSVNEDLLVYLNGLMLAEGYDYIWDEELSLISLSARTVDGDVITYVSVSDQDANGLVVDNIYVEAPISSGPTDGEGSNSYYYNTTQGKYELFTELTPVDGNQVVVTLNGVTLAPNIDYYQSITNPKRIILEGNLLDGDVVNIVYNAYPSYVGEIYTNTPKDKEFIC